MRSVKMITNALGAADDKGATTRMWTIDETLNTEIEWQNRLANVFIDAGYAIEVQSNASISEVKVVETAPDMVEEKPSDDTVKRGKRKKSE
jgi:hypothetical protein